MTERQVELGRRRTNGEEINEDDIVPQWALDHARQTVEEVAAILGTSLHMPTELQITVHPPNQPISRDTASAFGGYSYTNTTSGAMAHALDRRTVNPVLVHEIGHHILGHILLHDLQRDADILRDASADIRFSNEEIDRFQLGLIFGDSTMPTFQQTLRMRGNLAHHGSRQVQYIKAFVGSEVMTPYQELFSDLIAAIHTRSPDALPAVFIQDDVRQGQTTPEHRYANRSFTRPRETSTQVDGAHDYLREVRWHIGESHLARAIANRAYTERLLAAVHRLIREEAIRHYREQRLSLPPGRLAVNTDFNARLDRLLADSN